MGVVRERLPLGEALDRAKAEVERLERAVKQATCAEVGRHTWVLMGGRNCGCVDQDGRGCGSCSVPVYECSVCKDCDYGENDEARQIIEQCEHEP